MPEPAAYLVKVREVVPIVPAYPGWELTRLTLAGGEVVFRLASKEPGQVGIFGVKNGAFYYAPISEKVLVPGNVWASAERAVKAIIKQWGHI